MRHYGESFEDVIATTLTPEQLIEAFDNGYGGIEGCSFTLWTKNRVYFPLSTMVQNGQQACPATL